jgi:outer membrane protein OmpA-like peptidoglycan-associated protein
MSKIHVRFLPMCAGLLLALALLFTAGCIKSGSNGNSSNSNTAPESTPSPAGSETPGAGNTTVSEPSLVSLSAGAIIVKKPAEYNEQWSAIWLIDEKPGDGWATPDGTVSEQTVVVALPEQTQLKKLTFDTASTDGDDGRAAKDIRVEMSNTSESDGFQPIADVSLQDKQNNQSFPVTADVAGRWVRLTIKNNHGSARYIELCDFRATGTQLTHSVRPNISGTYALDQYDLHVKQEGTSVTGCYERNDGILEGGLNGPALNLSWKQSNGKGNAIMVFSPDGKKITGVWWNEGDNGSGNIWDGVKKSDDVGKCGNWAGGAQEQITKDLEEAGRARIYGINFDSDSDKIKSESNPTLDKIAGILKAKPDWKMTIEGHTDSQSSAAHNQDLSERRAAAVKTYLQGAGIDAGRLSTVGFGATKPVASNDTELGRAQNRRVELTKQ